MSKWDQSFMKELLYTHRKKIRKAYSMIVESREIRDTVTSKGYDSFRNLENINKHTNFKPSQISSEITQLTDLVNALKPKVLCEIGSYRGGTLYLLSHAAPSDAMIISIDINYPFERKLANGNLVRKGQKLICIEGNTQDPKTIERVKKALKGRPIDFLFIDGDHSLFGIMNDYVRFCPLVKRGGVIAFHDIHPDSLMKTGIKSSSYVGGVPVFWELIKNSNSSSEEVVEDPEQDGFGIGFLHKE